MWDDERTEGRDQRGGKVMQDGSLAGFGTRRENGMGSIGVIKVLGDGIRVTDDVIAVFNHREGL